MADPSWLLQQAIYAALTTPAMSISGFASIPVYDGVPANAARPYVAIGDDAMTDDSPKDEAAWLVAGLLEVWDDNQRGRKNIKLIFGQIRSRLQDAALTVTGFRVEWVKFQSLATQRTEDGLTWRGEIRFEIRISEA
jgi:hypothetical protein